MRRRRCCTLRPDLETVLARRRFSAVLLHHGQARNKVERKQYVTTRPQRHSPFVVAAQLLTFADCSNLQDGKRAVWCKAFYGGSLGPICVLLKPNSVWNCNHFEHLYTPSATLKKCDIQASSIFVVFENDDASHHFPTSKHTAAFRQPRRHCSTRNNILLPLQKNNECMVCFTHVAQESKYTVNPFIAISAPLVELTAAHPIASKTSKALLPSVFYSLFGSGGPPRNWERPPTISDVDVYNEKSKVSLLVIRHTGIHATARRREQHESSVVCCNHNMPCKRRVTYQNTQKSSLHVQESHQLPPTPSAARTRGIFCCCNGRPASHVNALARSRVTSTSTCTNSFPLNIHTKTSPA